MLCVILAVRGSYPAVTEGNGMIEGTVCWVVDGPTFRKAECAFGKPWGFGVSTAKSRHRVHSARKQEQIPRRYIL